MNYLKLLLLLVFICVFLPKGHAQLKVAYVDISLEMEALQGQYQINALEQAIRDSIDKYGKKMIVILQEKYQRANKYTCHSTKEDMKKVEQRLKKDTEVIMRWDTILKDRFPALKLKCQDQWRKAINEELRAKASKKGYQFVFHKEHLYYFHSSVDYLQLGEEKYQLSKIKMEFQDYLTTLESYLDEIKQIAAQFEREKFKLR